MLIEQSFLMLPEILHGSGYQQQSYEAGLVGVFSLAVLQSLNGRNVNDPIARMQHERLYRRKGEYIGLHDPRYLRADLYLNLYSLRVGNRRLSQYGWRHNAWLEAKFLRNQAGDDGLDHSSNKTTTVASFISDIVRLCSLVPEKGSESANGRYFLHVYDAEPRMYLAFRNRSWAKAITSPGRQKLLISDLAHEVATVKDKIGKITDLSIEADVTNTVVVPSICSHQPVYYCFLTRIDAFKISVPGHSFEIDVDRKITLSDPEAANKVAAYVAENLSIPKGSPELAEPVQPEDGDKEPESFEVSDSNEDIQPEE